MIIFIIFLPEKFLSEIFELSEPIEKRWADSTTTWLKVMPFKFESNTMHNFFSNSVLKCNTETPDYLLPPTNNLLTNTDT